MRWRARRCCHHRYSHLPATSIQRPAQARPARPSGVMLAYLFTFNPHATSLGCPEMFVRSFKATRSKQSELVLLYELPPHAKRESCTLPRRAIGRRARNRAAGRCPCSPESHRPRAVRIPPGAFLWYLSLPDNAHEFAGVLDADIFFQVDVFDAIFLEPLATQSEERCMHVWRASCTSLRRTRASCIVPQLQSVSKVAQPQTARHQPSL